MGYGPLWYPDDKGQTLMYFSVLKDACKNHKEKDKKSCHYTNSGMCNQRICPLCPPTTKLKGVELRSVHGRWKVLMPARMVNHAILIQHQELRLGLQAMHKLQHSDAWDGKEYLVFE